MIILQKKILPKIFPSNETDKRALVPLSELKMIGPGVFEIDGFAVFAHSFFRRSQSQLNNLNIFFLTKLYEISQKTGLDVKIALDPNSLGIPETYMRPIELNYWWGPKFNENLNNIPTGVTIHNSNGKRERFFSGISKTEFWWHKQNDIQSLECEEIRDIPSFGISKVSENFGCRYVHSMINQSGVPFHLDGAVRVYTEEKMLSRLDVDISKAGKDTEYFKLWRVDGDIKIKEWKELISDFFWDNELVGEYLGGVDERQHNFDVDVSDDKNTEDKYIQPEFMEGSGVNIFISCFESRKIPVNQDVSYLSTYSIVSNDSRNYVFEFAAIDFIKIIRKSFIDIENLSKDAIFIAYEDLDINLPLILCSGSDAVRHSNVIIDCIYKFCSMINLKKERTVTASVGIFYDETLVKISFIFKPDGFCQLYEKNNIKIPDNIEEIGLFAENIQMEMENLFRRAQCSLNDRHHLDQIGEMRIARKYVPFSMILLDNENAYLKEDMINEEIKNLIDNKKIILCPAFFVSKALCRSCGKDYFTCDCLSFENDKGVDMSEVELMSFFWCRP